MSAFMGEFLGFTLGDLHSSQLNITRVSNNNRYIENLSPNFSDNVVSVPGGTGTYYLDTNYTQQVFTIDFAFDDLRDEDIRRLKQIFGFSGVKQLIFDESSYKKYYVKCSAPPIIKYVPFGLLGDMIVYKGEGSIQLVAYYPYGISTEEINLKTNDANVPKSINNIGDIPTQFKLIYNLPQPTIDPTTHTRILPEPIKIELNLLKVNENIGKLVLSDVVCQAKKDIRTDELVFDKYICIDMKTHLIEGLNEDYQKTGLLYNKFITDGDFFSFPVGQSKLISDTVWDSLQYHYLYY